MNSIETWMTIHRALCAAQAEATDDGTNSTAVMMVAGTALGMLADLLPEHAIEAATDAIRRPGHGQAMDAFREAIKASQ